MSNGVRNSGYTGRRGIAKRAVSLILMSMLITSGLVIFSGEGRSDVLSGATITVPDDYATIGEALAHVNDGDVIQVRAGTWQMGVNVFKKITLRSVDGAAVTILETSNYHGIYLYTEARIDGFTLRQASTALLVDQSSQHTNVSNCVFLNTSVQVQPANVEFWNNTFVGNPSYGFQLMWSGDHASISDNTFLSTADLYLTGDNASVWRNEFDNAEAFINGDFSIFSNNLMVNTSYEALTVNGKNCTVIDNDFRDIGRRAINLQSGPNWISENRFLRCHETGVYVTGSGYGGEGNAIGWNTFDECDFAVQISSQRYTRVHNNTILNGNPGGARESNLRVTSDRNIIENNSLYGCRKTGISVRGDGNIIRYNNVSAGIGRYDSALFIYDPNTTVLWNELYQNDGNGINCYGDDCRIGRNKVMFNDGYGIRISATGCEITWNDLIFNNISADSDVGNFWDYNLFSDYNGPDATNDGIGDLPYTVSIVGVQDLHPRYLKATNVGEINLGIVPLNYNDLPADGALQYDEDYYLQVGAKISSYFQEASYGQLTVSVQVLSDDGGAWYRLPYSKAQLRNFSMNDDKVSKLLRMVDDDHDLRAYDYNASGGMGCLAFVASVDFEGDDSSFIIGANVGTGSYGTNDSTTVDYIYSYTARFNGANRTVRALSHEYAHFLGKALTTVPQGSTRDNEWLLPDEYTMGRLTCYDSLMGRLTDRSLERVHPDAYIKEWLGWLTYSNLTVGDNVSVGALPLLGYGGKLYRIPYTLPGSGYRGYVTIEYRTNASDISDWDTQTLYERALRINIVRVINGAPDKINPYMTLESVDDQEVNPSWLGSTLRLVEMNDTSAVVELVANAPTNLTGAVMAGNGSTAGAAGAASRHDNSGWVGYPDTDLHARDRLGRHVGMNHTTGEYEVQIPGTDCSGDMLNGLEWIYVPADLEPEFWVEADDVVSFVADNPRYAGYARDEGFAIMIQHFDAQGGQTNTKMRERSVTPGESYQAEYTLTAIGSDNTLVLDDSVRTVTFRQSGLPTGTYWSVSVGSQTCSSVTDSISLQLVSGEHQYTVEAVIGFVADPGSGTLVLGDQDLLVEIEFGSEDSAENGSDLNIVILAVVLVAAAVGAVLVLRSRRKR